MGVEIARNLSEIFKDVPRGTQLFRRFSLITPEMVPDYEARLARLATSGELSEQDSEAFLALALAYIEPRMRFGLLDKTLAARIVGARGIVQTRCRARTAGHIETHDPPALTPGRASSITSCSAASTSPGCTARKSCSGRSWPSPGVRPRSAHPPPRPRAAGRQPGAIAAGTGGVRLGLTRALLAQAGSPRDGQGRRASRRGLGAAHQGRGRDPARGEPRRLHRQ